MTDDELNGVNVEEMMAEDYFSIGKYKKAIELFKKIGKEVSTKKLEECAKSSLRMMDLENALAIFELAGTSDEVIKQAFVDQALDLLKDESFFDLDKVREILGAVKINPADSEKIKNCLKRIAEKMKKEKYSARSILNVYEMSGEGIPKEEIVNLAVHDIKHANKKCKEEAIIILEEFSAEAELRKLAKYFLDFPTPKEKMARIMYEAISRIKNK